MWGQHARQESRMEPQYMAQGAGSKMVHPKITTTGYRMNKSLKKKGAKGRLGVIMGKGVNENNTSQRQGSSHIQMEEHPRELLNDSETRASTHILEHAKVETGEDIDREYENMINNLRDFHDSRFRDLREYLRTTQDQFRKDIVIQTMQGDPTSKHFVLQRMKEILGDSLASERESTIHTLTQENALQKTQLHRLESQLGQFEGDLGELGERENEYKMLLRGEKKHNYDAQSEISLLRGQLKDLSDLTLEFEDSLKQKEEEYILKAKELQGDAHKWSDEAQELRLQLGKAVDTAQFQGSELERAAKEILNRDQKGRELETDLGFVVKEKEGLLTELKKYKAKFTDLENREREHRRTEEGLMVELEGVNRDVETLKRDKNDMELKYSQYGEEFKSIIQVNKQTHIEEQTKLLEKLKKAKRLIEDGKHRNNKMSAEFDSLKLQYQETLELQKTRAINMTQDMEEMKKVYEMKISQDDETWKDKLTQKSIFYEEKILSVQQDLHKILEEKTQKQKEDHEMEIASYKIREAETIKRFERQLDEFHREWLPRRDHENFLEDTAQKLTLSHKSELQEMKNSLKAEKEFEVSQEKSRFLSQLSHVESEMQKYETEMRGMRELNMKLGQKLEISNEKRGNLEEGLVELDKVKKLMEEDMREQEKLIVEYKEQLQTEMGIKGEQAKQIAGVIAQNEDYIREKKDDEYRIKELEHELGLKEREVSEFAHMVEENKVKLKENQGETVRIEIGKREVEDKLEKLREDYEQSGLEHQRVVLTTTTKYETMVQNISDKLREESEKLGIERSELSKHKEEEKVLGKELEALTVVHENTLSAYEEMEKRMKNGERALGEREEELLAYRRRVYELEEKIERTLRESEDKLGVVRQKAMQQFNILREELKYIKSNLQSEVLLGKKSMEGFIQDLERDTKSLMQKERTHYQKVLNERLGEVQERGEAAMGEQADHYKNENAQITDRYEEMVDGFKGRIVELESERVSLTQKIRDCEQDKIDLRKVIEDSVSKAEFLGGKVRGLEGTVEHQTRDMEEAREDFHRSHEQLTKKLGSRNIKEKKNLELEYRETITGLQGEIKKMKEVSLSELRGLLSEVGSLKSEHSSEILLLKTNYEHRVEMEDLKIKEQNELIAEYAYELREKEREYEEQYSNSEREKAMNEALIRQVQDQLREEQEGGIMLQKRKNREFEELHGKTMELSSQLEVKNGIIDGLKVENTQKGVLLETMKNTQERLERKVNIAKELQSSAMGLGLTLRSSQGEGVGAGSLGGLGGVPGALGALGTSASPRKEWMTEIREGKYLASGSKASQDIRDKEFNRTAGLGANVGALGHGGGGHSSLRYYSRDDDVNLSPRPFKSNTLNHSYRGAERDTHL